MATWDDLKFVLAVGRAGGLSAAARDLGVEHSTVSRRISACEARLGVRLFDRLPTGFIPTSDGIKAIAAATRIEQDIFSLDRQIAAGDKALAGQLRITAPQLIIQTDLAGMLEVFSARYPEIDLTVSSANEVLNLHRREADVAIRMSRSPEPNLYGRIITKQNRGFYVSKKYIETISSTLSVDNHSAPVNFVNFTLWEKLPLKKIRSRFPNARISISLDEMGAVHSAIRANMGLGLMPCFLGDRDPLLQRVPGFELQPYWDIWVLTHPDLKNTGRVRLFMRFIAEEFKLKSPHYLGDG